MGAPRLSATPTRTAVAAMAGALAVAGCANSRSSSRSTSAANADQTPAALVRERRPIGRGARFHPPATGSVPGPCRPELGPRFGAHVELFAADRVVLVAAGIGARAPLRRNEGRIAHARCYGSMVTLEPTGVVLVRPGQRLGLDDLFRAWGQSLSRRRLASFTASPGRAVVAYVDGRRWRGAPGHVPLTRHAEIVLEVGPRVPPHTSYTFPPGS